MGIYRCDIRVNRNLKAVYDSAKNDALAGKISHEQTKSSLLKTGKIFRDIGSV